MADVCKVLELGNSAMTATRLDADEKGISTIDTSRGPQQAIIVSEAGLYKLLMTSRKPAAKRFDRWVRHEVLPEIRRTGSYRGHDRAYASLYRASPERTPAKFGSDRKMVRSR